MKRKYQLSIIALTALLFFGFFIGSLISHHFILNKSELLDAMNSTSRDRLTNETERLNKLISNLRKTKSDANHNSISDRQEMSKLYLSLANVLTDDLRNIQLKNPSVAANTRVIIDGLRVLSNDIKKEDIYPEFFWP